MLLGYVANILLAFDKGLHDLRVEIKWFIQDLFIGSNCLATHGSISCEKVGHQSFVQEG